jgi:adenine-specific DNA-methyltransferase
MKYLEPLAREQMGYLYKIPDIGGDDRGYRYFITPESEKQVNGSYFQGVPTDRADVKEVPYPNYFDFEEEFNNVGYEGGVDFRNGKKPVAFLQKVFEIGNLIENTDAIVLDFFAGSGSTGHALMAFNKEHTGHRQFILCTNNEADICEKVTYPRLVNVMGGYKTRRGDKIDPLGGSLKYFKTTFVKRNANTDDFKMRITNECTEMLCLREGVFNEVTRTDQYRVFQQGNKILAVYYSIDRQSLPSLKNELENMDGEKTLYCFTLDPFGLSKTEFSGWHDVSLEPIPQIILDIYKQIYEY